ncbi:MAG: hypothetical protein ACPGYT_02985, partial [Nitrospirales bacterium]
MFRILRWLEGKEWRTVCVLSFISSFTLSLVFAGPANESVEQRMDVKDQRAQNLEQSTFSLSLSSQTKAQSKRAQNSPRTLRHLPYDAMS